MTIEHIKQLARTTQDDDGNPIVQLPLAAWVDLLNQLEVTAQSTQVEQVKSLLKEWEQDTDDDLPDAWWDDFQAFLKETRFNASQR